MHETLQHPLWAIFYIICVIAVVFHFANGLWSFCVTWGFYNLKITTCFTWISLIVFLVISYIGVEPLLRLYKYTNFHFETSSIDKFTT